MLNYALRRVLLLVPVLVLVTLVAFALVRIVPGDPAEAQLGEGATPEQIEALRQEYGLDDPLWRQYTSWLADAVRLDFGEALRGSRAEVRDLIGERLPVTAELALLSVIIGTALGISTGIVSAVFAGSVLDTAMKLFAFVGLGVPSFVLGSLAVLLPAVWWGWTPPSDYVSFFSDPVSNLSQFILPSVVLGLGLAGTIARMTRSQMVEVLRQDYIRTARAKGLGESNVMLRHALRNALIPVITLTGLQLGGLLGGTVVTESIFALPGMGRLVIESVEQRDYASLQAIVVVMSTAYLLINLVVDLSYAVIDPRIRVS